MWAKLSYWKQQQQISYTMFYCKFKPTVVQYVYSITMLIIVRLSCIITFELPEIWRYISYSIHKYSFHVPRHNNLNTLNITLGIYVPKIIVIRNNWKVYSTKVFCNITVITSKSKFSVMNIQKNSVVNKIIHIWISSKIYWQLKTCYIKTNEKLCSFI